MRTHQKNLGSKKNNNFPRIVLQQPIGFLHSTPQPRKTRLHCDLSKTFVMLSLVGLPSLPFRRETTFCNVDRFPLCHQHQPACDVLCTSCDGLIKRMMVWSSVSTSASILSNVKSPVTTHVDADQTSKDVQRLADACHSRGNLCCHCACCVFSMTPRCGQLLCTETNNSPVLSSRIERATAINRCSLKATHRACWANDLRGWVSWALIEPVKANFGQSIFGQSFFFLFVVVVGFGVGKCSQLFVFACLLCVVCCVLLCCCCVVCVCVCVCVCGGCV